MGAPRRGTDAGRPVSDVIRSPANPIVKYVPELREVHDPFGDPSEITLRQLLSHSAGFRDATWPWGGEKDWHPFEPRLWEQQ